KTSKNEFPEFDSEEVLEALKYLKYLKSEIASDDIFKYNENFIIKEMNKGTGIFTRMWDTETTFPHLNKTSSPGSKKGINTHTSILGGMNVGINKFISEERKKASLEVIKFFTSEEIQRELIVKKFLSYSAIEKLYDDEEVCSYLSCLLVKDSNPITRIFEMENSDVYKATITDILNKYLFENISAEKVLDEIINIKKVYNFSIKSASGLIIFVLLTSVACIILFLFLILIQDKFHQNYQLFSKDQWWMYCIGILLIICSQFFNYGKLSSIKCQTKFSMFFLGITVTYIPILYKLTISFPNSNNKYKIFYKNNKNIYICGGLLIELVNNILFAFSPFTVENKMYYDTNMNKNFNRCTMTNKYGNIIVLVEIIEKLFMMTMILILSFCDWNNSKKIGKEEILYFKSVLVEKSEFVSTNTPESESSITKKIISFHYRPYSIATESVITSSQNSRRVSVLSDNIRNSIDYSANS
ncbi:hypothetical protein BCR36DRAFT_304316, partial [Piromyces finnis]